MKNNDPKICARALYEATKNLRGNALTAAVNRFVRLLARKQMLKRADRIMAEFAAYGKKAEGIRELKIESARPLGESVVTHLKSVFGAKAETEEKVNPALLGGVVVQVGDTIFDGSLRRQLLSLRKQLTN